MCILLHLMEQVHLPSNAVPGSKLNVATDNGKSFEIVVPEGAHPGDTITVQIPHDLTVNDKTTYINANGEVEHSSNRKALGAAAVATVAGALVVVRNQYLYAIIITIIIVN